MSERFLITGNGTGIGKTCIAAICVEALRANYWKPVQAGDLEATDSMRIQALISIPTQIFPETYRLKAAMSPHAAAAREGIQIQLRNFKAPESEKPLIIEGAGGVYVPLNSSDTMLDLMLHLDARILLISQQYLGSINHTLLTWEALKNRKIPIAGIIFNGPRNEESEEIILQKTGLPCLLHVDQEDEFTQTVVEKYAEMFRKDLL